MRMTRNGEKVNGARGHEKTARKPLSLRAVLLCKENSMLCMEFIQLIAMSKSSSDVV